MREKLTKSDVEKIQAEIEHRIAYYDANIEVLQGNLDYHEKALASYQEARKGIAADGAGEMVGVGGRTVLLIAFLGASVARDDSVRVGYLHHVRVAKTAAVDARDLHVGAEHIGEGQVAGAETPVTQGGITLLAADRKPEGLIADFGVGLLEIDVPVAWDNPDQAQARAPLPILAYPLVMRQPDVEVCVVCLDRHFPVLVADCPEGRMIASANDAGKFCRIAGRFLWGMFLSESGQAESPNE